VGSTSPKSDGAGFSVNSDGTLTPGSESGGGLTFTKPHEPDYGALGALSVAFGFVYLIGVAVLDARGRRGIATAAVIPGVIAMLDAVIFLGQKADNIVVTGLLTLAAGLFVGAVGAQSQRRTTVWFGAIGATLGVVILTTKIADSTTNSGSNSHAASVFGAFTIAFGVVMVVAAFFIARLLHEPTTGDDPRPVAPPADFAPPATEPPPPGF
jgi:drug/metabolite transporter (DMT)-like permease